MPTLEENVNRVKAAKTAIGAAITAKGGTVGANDGLEDFAADIATIPSGGNYNAEFINIPTAFNLKDNIKSIEIPSGITSIEDSAFYDCDNLVSVKIPSSVITIGNNAFAASTSLQDINIYNEPNAISGAPWGAPNTTNINWLRHNNYTSAVNEVSSGTTLGITVSCTVGDLVIATFVIRGENYTLRDGWTLLGISDYISPVSLQRTGMAYKIAASTTESLMVTQDVSERIYINLVAITGASIGTFSGFTNNNTGNSITVNKPTGLVVWAVSARAWGNAPIIPWVISPNDDIASISLSTTAPRLLNALDQSNNDTITFSAQPYSETIPSDIVAASLTITGIDNFWYYDEI